jgi:hypothetical protein
LQASINSWGTAGAAAGAALPAGGVVALADVAAKLAAMTAAAAIVRVTYVRFMLLLIVDDADTVWISPNRVVATVWQSGEPWVNNGPAPGHGG